MSKLKGIFNAGPIAMLLMCSTVAACESKTDSATRSGKSVTPVPAVFESPPSDELAKNAHPKIRNELLRRVHLDQLAHSAGT